MTAPRAVISDFGGVLTTPLIEAFLALQRDSGIPLEAMGQAVAALSAQDGGNPLYALETGRLSERDFVARLERALSDVVGRPVELAGFSERWFAQLQPNQELLDYLRGLRERGLRLALLTNNVREWEPLWRAKLPVDELFEVVVDSAFVGVRKPDPEIYRLTLERLDLPAEACVFVDDNELNVRAARELGMRAVWFQSTDQAIADVERALDGSRV
jgi:putative hydrolase of the HAD superfamily